MKAIFFVCSCLIATFAMSGEEDVRRNFLAEYKFVPDPKPVASLETVKLQPFEVSGNKIQVSTSVGYALERLLRRKELLTEPQKKLMTFAPPDDGSMALSLPSEERYMVQRNIAIVELGGDRVFGLGNLYAKGSLSYRMDNWISIGIRSGGHGIKALVVKIDRIPHF